MKLRLAAALSFYSVLTCAYQPRVYLLPTRGMLSGKVVVSANTPLTLSMPQANKVLANHLGLEMFESIRDAGESKEWQHLLHGGLDSLLHTGDRPGLSTVMLVLHTDRPEDVLSLPSRDPLPSNPDFYINSTLSAQDVSALVHTYVTYAQSTYDTVTSGSNSPLQGELDDSFDINAKAFKVPGESAKLFLEEYTAIERYKVGGASLIPTGSDEHRDPRNFATFEIKSLDLLLEEYGPLSEQYQLATQIVRNWLDLPNWNGDDILALVVKPRSSPAEAHVHQSRAVPVERRAGSPGGLAIYSCFSDASTCGNATSACSGRGSCVSVMRAGKTCFTCKCSPSKSKDGMSTTYWAGEKCERQDVSSPFVLLVGTVLGIMLVAFGSIALLYGVGDEKLPQTLTGAPQSILELAHVLGRLVLQLHLSPHRQYKIRWTKSQLVCAIFITILPFQLAPLILANTFSMHLQFLAAALAVSYSAFATPILRKRDVPVSQCSTVKSGILSGPGGQSFAISDDGKRLVNDGSDKGGLNVEFQPCNPNFTRWPNSGDGPYVGHIYVPSANKCLHVPSYNPSETYELLLEDCYFSDDSGQFAYSFLQKGSEYYWSGATMGDNSLIQGSDAGCQNGLYGYEGGPDDSDATSGSTTIACASGSNVHPFSIN